MEVEDTPPHVFVIEFDRNSGPIPVEKSSKSLKTDILSLVIITRCYQWIKGYVKKFIGLHEKRPKRLSWDEYLWSFIGSFIGIAAVAFFHYKFFKK